MLRSQTALAALGLVPPLDAVGVVHKTIQRGRFGRIGSGSRSADVHSMLSMVTVTPAVAAAVPVTPEASDSMVENEGAQGTGQVQDSLGRGCGEPQAVEAASDPRKIEQTKRQIVVHSACHGTDEQVQIELVLPLLPTGLWVIESVELLVEMPEQLAQRQDWVQAPVIGGVKLFLGRLDRGRVPRPGAGSAAHQLSSDVEGERAALVVAVACGRGAVQRDERPTRASRRIHKRIRGFFRTRESE